MKTIKFISLVILSLVLITSCENDEDQPTTGNLTLNISGLEDLGTNFVYEGWLIVDGAPVTTGIFKVNTEGQLSQTAFTLNSDDVSKASAFVLTIEPSNDPDPSPSKVHILAGNISSSTASLSVGHAAALGNNFAGSSGQYILATPTDDADNNENSGVWFLDPSSGSAAAGLNLPALPEGWEYEGWAVIDGTPVTTGKFTSLSQADASAPFSGPNQGPPFPGEDFLENAPGSLTFPTDLSGAKVVISIEPVPDNSSAPFLLKPLLGDVPANAAVHTPYMLGNISANTNPTGSASLSIQ